MYLYNSKIIDMINELSQNCQVTVAIVGEILASKVKWFLESIKLIKNGELAKKRFKMYSIGRWLAHLANQKLTSKIQYHVITLIIIFNKNKGNICIPIDSNGNISGYSIDVNPFNQSTIYQSSPDINDEKICYGNCTGNSLMCTIALISILLKNKQLIINGNYDQLSLNIIKNINKKTKNWKNSDFWWNDLNEKNIFIPWSMNPFRCYPNDSNKVKKQARISMFYILQKI